MLVVCWGLLCTITIVGINKNVIQFSYPMELKTSLGISGNICYDLAPIGFLGLQSVSIGFVSNNLQ